MKAEPGQRGTPHNTVRQWNAEVAGIDVVVIGSTALLLLSLYRYNIQRRCISIRLRQHAPHAFLLAGGWGRVNHVRHGCTSDCVDLAPVITCDRVTHGIVSGSASDASPSFDGPPMHPHSCPSCP